VLDQREQQQQSEHSPNPPGVVLDEERLGRIVIAPEHYDESEGELLPAAIKKGELLGGGWSVARLDHAAADDIRNKAEELEVRRDENKFAGIVWCVTNFVRGLTDDDGDRCFYVVDDGLADYRSHALVQCTKRYSDSIVRKYRKQLLDELGNTLYNVDDLVAD
jgi:hypothetical protein